jgi:hypothetical protein
VDSVVKVKKIFANSGFNGAGKFDLAFMFKYSVVRTTYAAKHHSMTMSEEIKIDVLTE